MNLQPGHWSTGAMKPWVAGADRGSIWLPLEVISPKSAVGRKAHLYLSEEDVTALLKELKAIAKHQRSQPLLEGQSWLPGERELEEGYQDPDHPLDTFTDGLEGAADDYA